MRWFLSTILVLVASPVFAQAQENEAEKLFRAMEKKIKEAKSLKVVFEGEMGIASGDLVKLKGTLYVTEGNKVRGEIDAKYPGLPALLVSDGKQMTYSAHSFPSSTKPIPAKNFGATHGDFLVTDGAYMSIMATNTALEQIEGFEIRKALPLSQFKLGVKERIGERNAQLVEYDFTNFISGHKTHIRLWIDLDSLSPLKRQRHDSADSKKNILNETYTEFVLNPKLDPKFFELPK